MSPPARTLSLNGRLRLATVASLLVLALAAAGRAGDALQFSHVTTRDGLSQGSVQCLLRDHLGFFWFGTEDGLNKFDGSRFTVYRNHQLDSLSLSDNRIWALLEDNARFLWIGTQRGGLSRFDRYQETFTNWRHDPADSNSLSHNQVQALCQTRDGAIWAGTYDGLNRLDPHTGRITRYLPRLSIRGLVEDAAGSLWIATRTAGLYRLTPATPLPAPFPAPTDNGARLPRAMNALGVDGAGGVWAGTARGRVLRCDVARNRLVPLVFDPAHPDSGCGAVIHALAPGSRGTLWIATDGQGLFRADPATGALAHFTPEPGRGASLASDHLYSVFEAPDGAVWVGLWGKGVDVGRAPCLFTRLAPLAAAAPLPEGTSILSFCEDRHGRLWIGTRGEGVVLCDPATGHWETPLPLPGKDITAILENPAGRLWIGTALDGLMLHDPATGAHSTLRLSLTSQRLTSDAITALAIDHRETLWIGTLGGLYRWNGPGEAPTEYRHRPGDATSLCHNAVTALCEDRQGRLWVGTTNGLAILNRERLCFQHVPHVPTDPRTLSDNEILALHETPDGTLWAGTPNGLNRLHPDSLRITRYTIDDGLPSGVIDGITHDRDGYLWLTTNRGIVRLDPRGARPLLKYTAADGLQDNEFNPGALVATRAGTLWAGGVSGFNGFDPAAATAHWCPVRITRVTDHVSRQILCRDPHGDVELVLPHERHSVSFEFTTLDYRPAAHSDYACRLEGLASAWLPCGRQTFASFTNLAPGRYTFLVRDQASTPPAEARIRLRILPPFWTTWWFRTLEALVAAAAAVLLFVVLRRGIRERSAAQIKRDIQLDNSRKVLLDTLAVFGHRKTAAANLDSISRKLKMMQAGGVPAAQVQRGLEEAIFVYLDYTAGQLSEIISRVQAAELGGELTARLNHAVRTLTAALVAFQQNGLTDADRASLLTDLPALIEQTKAAIKALWGRVILYYSCDVPAACRRILNARAAALAQAGVTCTGVSVKGDGPPTGFIDPGDFEHVFDDLITNALRAMAAAHRRILTVEITLDERAIQVSVTDTGCGLRREDFDRVFDVSFSTKPAGEGGFGLFNARGKIERCQGKIRIAESEIGRGTRLQLELPRPKEGVMDHVPA